MYSSDRRNWIIHIRWKILKVNIIIIIMLKQIRIRLYKLIKNKIKIGMIDIYIVIYVIIIK
jgi:hypothetical protein